MRKILELDDYFPTGEQTVQPVLLWGPGRNRQDLSHITKTASEAIDYIKNVVPEPGKTHLLLLALGSEEAYGPNRNGDGFPERPVRARDGRGWWIRPGEELTNHYHSFETNPAHVFQHHSNRDATKASGVVKKAFWNPRMHRVELLVVIDNRKDPEWVQRVNDGDFPACSMGCRITADRCSICGNAAPTRADYCQHARFQMNQILPDGRKVYVHNPSPDFFDISRVFRPADRTGYTLKKVAHVYELRSSAELGETVDDIERKSAALAKLSDIDKVIRGEPIASASNLEPHEAMLVRRFRDHVQPRLAEPPALPMAELIARRPAEVLSTLSSMGIILTTPEFLRYIVSQLAGHSVPIDEETITRATALQPTVFSLLAQSPALLDRILSSGILDESPAHIDDDLRQRLAPFTEKRSSASELLYRRLVPEGIGLRRDEAPRTDVLSYTDPSTGNAYSTTRGAGVDAADAVTRADLKRMLGGGALLAGAYKALTAFPSLRPFKIPLGLAAGAAGVKLLRPGAGRTLPASQGLDVPEITEWSTQPKQAADNLSAIVVSLLDDYRRVSSEKLARADLAERIKEGGTIDHLMGLRLDLDTVAESLGALIVK